MSQPALMAATARRAVTRSGAVTPTNSPSLTTSTPGSCSAGPISALRSVAPRTGGRSTAPYRMFGTSWSDA